MHDLSPDPPDHRRMRALVNGAFTPRAISNLRETVVRIVRKYLRAAEPGRFDVVRDLSAPFPAELIMQMAGVPAESAERVRFQAEKTMSARAGDEGFTETLLEVFGFYHNLVQERRLQPADDMTSALIGAEVARDNGEVSNLDDLEIASFVMLLGGAGQCVVAQEL